MNKLSLTLVAAGVLACGCTSTNLIYTPVEVGNVALLDYQGPLNAESVLGMNEDKLLELRQAEGYTLVGRSDFIGRSLDDWTREMEDMGRKAKAEKIYYRTWHSTVENLGGLSGVSTAYPTTATEMPTFESQPYAPGVDDLRDMSPTCSDDYNEYHVYFFKKRK